MKWIICIATFLACLIVLTSCKQERTASDGYTFEQGTPALSERQIKVVKYPSYDALRKAYAAMPGGRQLGQNEELQAFSAINDKTCTIHMIDPAVKYQPDFFGHELVHCLYGEFHPSQNER